MGIPVILTAFGFHIVIPSITQYIGREVSRLKMILLLGSLIPLIVYIAWVASLLGTIPYQGEYSLATIVNNRLPLQALIFTIDKIQASVWMSTFINLFSHVIIITSFLGVTLSLFDFLRDKEHEIIPHRARTALLTFIPPLLVVILYPDAFIQLLSYASIFVALILIILPALMAWRLRHNPTLTTPYTVPGGTPLLVAVGLAGIAFIVIEVIRMSGGFAVWMG
jgi:amino acid permease